MFLAPPANPVLSPVPDLLWLGAVVGVSVIGALVVAGVIVAIVLGTRRADKTRRAS
jgi:hypothetical protein